MRNEPKRVTSYPILLSSTRQNNDVASNFFELWLDNKYQEDFVYCQASHKIVTRYKRDNSNLVRHLKTFTHKDTSSTKQNKEGSVALGEDGDAPRDSASTASTTLPEGRLPSSTHPPVPELVPVSSCSVSFSVRGRSASPHQLEAVPSEYTRTPHHTTQEEKAEAPSIAPILHLPAAPNSSVIQPKSLVDPEYGLDSKEEPEDQPSSRLKLTLPEPDTQILNSDMENDEASEGQMGGGRSNWTQFKEIACRSAFHNAMVCKTFEPLDVDADLHTLLFSFRDVIQRELSRILTLHPGVKAWISLTNLYDYKNKGINRELSIKTAPLFIVSEAGIAPLIVRSEKYIIERNSYFTVLGSNLE